MFRIGRARHAQATGKLTDFIASSYFVRGRRARYMTLETMAPVSDNPIVRRLMGWTPPDGIYVPR